ncbi:MAG: PhoH family protein [Planctomycetota bacterium]
MHLSIPLDHPEKSLALAGPADAHLKRLRELFDVSITLRNGDLKLSGPSESVARAARVVERMQELLRRKEHLSSDDGGLAITDVREDEHRRANDSDAVEVFSRGSRIKAKTDGQRAYLRAIFDHDLTFCTGPAGTGKTYLAVAAAAAMLKRHAVKRIVLARPAVEAGERLGFLPGDMAAKVNPYLRPLLDALGDMMDLEQVKRFMVNDVIEVIPLAFMRGRTFNDCVVILDEAQNTTVGQMLMFLTRLGNDSKMIVTGDPRQSDLDDGTPSGLGDALHRLRGVDGIAHVKLDKVDIVRHRLVQNIVDAYERGGIDASRVN